MTDDKRTKDARLLGEGIAHWDRLLALYLKGDREGVEREGWYTEECPLCAVYMDDGEDPDEEDPEIETIVDCTGCPVHADTGKTLCRGTPWRVAAVALSYLRNDGFCNDTGAAAIRAQGDYLRRLRAELGDVT